MGINFENFLESMSSFKGCIPFDHCVVDNFLNAEVAHALENEFLDYEDKKWFYYNNAIEDKKALNDWNKFPEITYRIFQQLMSEQVINILQETVGCKLYVDHGLHGGGWHIHGSGGNLNPHLDYSIHPKMGKLRKLNIIIYLSSTLRPEHGGHLGLWSANSLNSGPGELVKEIEPLFNRAVIFDTTQNSWHGMSRPLIQPNDIFRKSLAIYYLAEPNDNVDQRQRALFAPRSEQSNDVEIQELIKMRADPLNYHKVYRKD